ncbi:glutaminase family protein [uncultured Bacteroides sp.]|uniref:glutaminase family protein n=1 Tax=uncultured Bacteroides sp. TaxID=162156 RepID=UPI0025914ED7|nr:glutaminase family protein [uncultured Bacteroides sp.]
MKKRTTLTLLMLGALCHISASNIFTPVQKTDLRLPSVPLITSDPYFSIWSPYDKLNEGSTRHWTNDEKSLIGAVRVDGKVYRFMGKQAMQVILPMAGSEAWKGNFTFDKPEDNWTSPDYSADKWNVGKGAFGTNDQPAVRTEWNTKDIWVRREFTLDDININNSIYLKYSHDDIFELFLNGEKIVSTGYEWKNNVLIELKEDVKKKLRKGKNVIAAHCHNTTGGAYVDFGIYTPSEESAPFENLAIQKSVDVLPTQTYYTFVCGPVELDVVFTAPVMIDDLDLISTPINYISYQARSTDKKEHDVQVYIETTPQLSINEMSQPTKANVIKRNGLNYIQAGSINQPITGRKGDLICIDWGYAYLAGKNGANTTVSLGEYEKMKATFAQKGELLPTASELITRKADEMPAMAYSEDLGKVSTNGKSGFMMLGYDDIYSVEYMYERRMAYWKHDGKVTIFDAFEKAEQNYQSIMERCRNFDAMIMKDAEKAGGKKYAEICAASYRQVITAHKLFTDKEGNLMFFSKENNSNGCINTVDLTYPSAPLFLIYNPELQKAMMTSIFEYSASGRWNKPFAAHDLGTYPIANGQVYGGDMPIEESGNMVILAAAIAKAEGNANYAKKYWDLLTIWTNYLVEYGQDPENQLCTDDFAGHWAHNANLSVKAIMGIAAYSELAKMLGMNNIAVQYSEIAKKMAAKWKEMAIEEDHYRLAFDRQDTWSQKYNMVWDKMWGLNLFPEVIEKEINYYLTKQNEYGLPLDSRKEYTKSDWVMWTAAMSPDIKTFQKFSDPIYKYINETTSRVPISDWHHTDSGEWVGFRARSVIGGYWMQVLMDRILTEK